MRKTYSLEEIKERMSRFEKETNELYNELRAKFGYEYLLGMNGLGETVVSNMSTIKDVAKGEKECQAKMRELLGKVKA